MAIVQKLLLASASPRRQQLLQQIGVRFQLAEHSVYEQLRAGELAVQYTRRMSEEKAMSALDKWPENVGRVVLAADTAVVCAGEIMGKPADKDDAMAMLSRLSGRNHTVFSAVTVGTTKSLETRLSQTRVEFRSINRQEIINYWETGEPHGKAGAYGIQGYAAVFVKSLAGSYSGVMGLPLYETAQLLKACSINCWLEHAE